MLTRGFFAREAAHIARAIAERFEGGGALYAFGRGAYATEAAHLSVEFVHPVIVGKRALPHSISARRSTHSSKRSWARSTL